VSDALARKRYLQRHIEPDLPPAPQPPEPWQNVVVIPAYRESTRLLERIQNMPVTGGRTLVILVLNRPDTDPDPQANSALRNALDKLERSATGTLRMSAELDLYVHDLDALSGPVQAKLGVGLVRKIGCDIAYKWHCEGAVSGTWICSTDADASLPPGYFQALREAPTEAAAATFPFWHAAGKDAQCNRATALYELRLHHHVLGLEYAGSPYAWHSLGSCLAVTADAYARVRGFPRRAGGEDFYLLNKLAKTGPVIRLAGTCIALESRASDRVPFGTGPAVARISAAADPSTIPLFYHPACYQSLRALLAVVPDLQHSAPHQLPALMAMAGIEPALGEASSRALEAMGVAAALQHCRRQSRSPGQFSRQFHQWFDGFRTLKFIHALRAAGWLQCTLVELQQLQPSLWPSPDARTVDALREHIALQWGWRLQAGLY
jgi:hypothetical protein